jgi:hypothetical protein
MKQNSKAQTFCLFLNVFFVGLSHLATYIFLNFQIEPELAARFDFGMAFTPFPLSILDKTRFEPTALKQHLFVPNKKYKRKQ